MSELTDIMDQVIKDHPGAFDDAEDARYTWPERWEDLRKRLENHRPALNTEPPKFCSSHHSYMRAQLNYKFCPDCGKNLYGTKPPIPEGRE